MKTKVLFLSLLLIGLFTITTANAEEEKRNVAAFSEISLRISGNLYLTQGDKQDVRIEATPSTLDDIITEVKGSKLIIRFPNKSFFKRNFKPGKIDIFITVPDVDALSVSGSGDIIAKELKSRILNLAVSGSGDIEIGNLDSKRVKSSVSGSGNIKIGNGGVADELTISISGSGNFKGSGFEAEDVTVSTAGSGNCNVKSNGTIKARIAGSGSVYYKGNPGVDASIAGSGKVREM